MSWSVIAKKELRDASRSRRLFALIVTFVLFFAGAAFVIIKVMNTFGGNVSPETPAILSLTIPLGIFLPAVGIFSGYRSIVGERESGSLKLLLSLPHSRTDVVLGKFLGRTALVGSATLIGFLVGGIVTVALGAELPIVDYLSLIVLSVVLGAAFVSISVGFSASIRSEDLIVFIGFGLVLLFTMLWGVLTSLIGMLLRRYDLGSQTFQADIVSFIRALNPQRGFNSAYSSLSMLNNTSGDVFWQEGWFGFIVLAFWIVVPLAFGMWRFNRTELT
ncbi:ABC transporter permease subunit [Halocatena pleomorpha]|uniref:ABC transporter permease n=1 Tax=Halocatena pleomorpha TaxID=1785090 RepID=A0A3P3R8P3_9EURY|nr:ABC transporter permease subunit [Halocatena pleomorpha]RRJ29408.1 ABC transporter permease [Halocatena pleomorpha]